MLSGNSAIIFNYNNSTFWYETDIKRQAITVESGNQFVALLTNYRWTNKS